MFFLHESPQNAVDLCLFIDLCFFKQAIIFITLLAFHCTFFCLGFVLAAVL